MRSLSIITLLALNLAAGPVASEPGARVTVDAHPAVIGIKPLPDGRRLISLPAIEFALAITPQCATGTQPQSLSVSIADTRKTLGSGELDGHPTVAVSIAIPRKQASPLAVDGFCPADQSADASNTDLSIEDAFTAHVSLRCAGEEQQTIVYAAQPLGLVLHCEVTPDQDPSPASDK